MKDRDWGLWASRWTEECVPARLRAWRHSMDLTQKAMGAYLGRFERPTKVPGAVEAPKAVSAAVVQSWERGVNPIPFWLHVVYHEECSDRLLDPVDRGGMDAAQWELRVRAAHLMLLGVTIPLIGFRLGVSPVRIRGWRGRKWWGEAWEDAVGRESGTLERDAELAVKRMVRMESQTGDLHNMMVSRWVLERRDERFSRRSASAASAEVADAPYRTGGLPPGVARNPDAGSMLAASEDPNALFDEAAAL